MKQIIKTEILRAVAVMQMMAEDTALHATIEAVVAHCVAALTRGNKLLFMGNGGSAADAQHLAAEFVSRFAFDRPGLSAFSLATDTSVLTAIGNDYGYDQVFARQVQAVGKSGDILFGISTSGRSPNILCGLIEGRKLGLTTVGLAGNAPGEIAERCDYCLHVPADETPKIQEGHSVIGHIICRLVEQNLYGAGH